MLQSNSKNPDVIIHIIGTQPMPNLLTPLNWKAAHNILLATERTRNNASAIVTVLSKYGINAEIKSIAKNDFQSVYNSLELILAELSGQNVWIHLTGGTKLMVASAFNFARTNGLPAIYLDFDSKRFILINPDMTINEVPLTVKISIDDYLFVHGYRINKKLDSIDHKIKEISNFMARNSKLILPKAGEKHPYGRRKKKSLFDLFKEYQRNPNILNPYRKKLFDMVDKYFVGNEKKISGFLNGKWLEYFVYGKIKDILDEAYMAVNLNEKIKSIPNEIDVLGIYQNRLILISCKSGYITKEHLAELDVLRRLIGGVQARAALVSSSAAHSQSMREIQLRAEVYHIKLFTSETFGNFSMDFKQWLNE